MKTMSDKKHEELEAWFAKVDEILAESEPPKEHVPEHFRESE
jgi:hypothetical protein